MIVSMIAQSDSGSESDTLSPIAANKAGNRTYHQAGGDSNSSANKDVKAQFNKTGGLNSPSPGLVENLPVSQRR